MIFDNITIISGGQSGIDRAALDFALENDIQCGGWCPLGRLAEDGIISNKYPLKETSTTEYKERTKLNIEDSDGTLILFENYKDEGTLLTIELANLANKPVMVIKLPVDKSFNSEQVSSWINANKIGLLNIAGPRESSSPGIFKLALQFLQYLL